MPEIDTGATLKAPERRGDQRKLNKLMNLSATSQKANTHGRQNLFVPLHWYLHLLESPHIFT